jgi:hypothetical protein
MSIPWPDFKLCNCFVFVLLSWIQQMSGHVMVTSAMVAFLDEELVTSV